MIDRPLMIALLETLRLQRALSCGTEENALANELNLQAAQPLTITLVREHLAMASDKGWIDWKLDSLNCRRWRITPAGAAQLDDLKRGG